MGGHTFLSERIKIPAKFVPGALRDGILKKAQLYLPGSDVGLAVAVTLLLSILILPLPTFVLDAGLSLSITSSILVLMVALFLQKPLDFTSFPVLLLLTTLLRLSLEIATTRFILSHGFEGPLAAGHVVAAFGGFLMGGDVVIGAILFLILLVVNFMVITKGSGRIAEVAARFSLDAMPGKQMAIDAEMSSGAITDAVGRRRRRDLEEESSFYGAMDGAAKFVRGDAIAGLIITAVNIVGGLAIGIGRHGMSVASAANSFTTLTIGDGLVSQIPALLVSTAAGIVVTKGGTEGGADVALARQLGGNAKPLALAACSAVLMAFMPGLPALPFLTLGTVAGAAAWYRHRVPSVDPAANVLNPEPPVEAREASERPLAESLRIDLIRLDLGFNLLSIASGDGARLTEQIKILRRTIAADIGFILPPVRIQDNLQIPSDRYEIKIKEVAVGGGDIRASRFLVMDPRGAAPKIDGEATREPAFGLPAVWVDQRLREDALVRGYTVVDPASVIATHLTEVIRENMPDLLSYVGTQKLLDDLPREQQKLVTDLVPSLITISALQRVLQNLLSERISIRDLPSVLEAVHEACGLGCKTVVAIAAHVRVRLARQICSSLTNSNGFIPIITLNPEWETALLESLVGPVEDRQLAMSPSQMADFVGRLRATIEETSTPEQLPVLVVGSAIRPGIRAIVERMRPTMTVLAQNEIFPRARIKTVASIGS